MVKKIALEEHFLCPGFEDYWNTTVEDVAPDILRQVVGRLSDFGAQRLEAMDAAGIERAVLGLSGPGVQIEPDTETAVRKAREANDFLANEVAKRPDRYAGFAHLAMQDPRRAADELERCMGELGFCGAMINGHTNGQYLDHPSIDPFWERVQDLRAMVYIHPTDPVSAYPAIAGQKALKRAMWEWTVETGTHALRLVFGGVFDRYPGVTIGLGHLGETLPFLVSRFDSRAKLYGLKLAKKPSDYIRGNFVVTTSGMFSADALMCSVHAMGQAHVLFSADYPFESTVEAAKFIDGVALSPEMRDDICFNNAARLLRLDGR